MDKISEIKERLSKATPGPWYWNVATKYKSAMLISDASMKPIVMDFVRWGMSSAAPRFGVIDLLRRVDELAVHRAEHHVGYDQYIDHPDADLIAHAPEDITYLLAEVERLQAELAQYKAVWGKAEFSIPSGYTIIGTLRRQLARSEGEHD